MFRFNRIVCVLVICSVVGAAFGAALKVKAFDWIHDENPDGDGMAIMNYHAGNNRTEITIAITDFLPETAYRLSVVPGVDAPVTTNPSGNANTHQFINFDICLFNTSGVDMIVWRDLNGDTFRTADEERARGHVDCP